MHCGLERPVIGDPLGDQINTDGDSHVLEESGGDANDPVSNGDPSLAYCVF